MSIAYINNSPRESGMGKSAYEVFLRLQKKLGKDIDFWDLDYKKHALTKNGEVYKKLSPWLLENKIVFWWRLKKTVPKEYDLYHLTNQTISFFPYQPKIVNVFDILEYIYPQRPFDRLVSGFQYRGIKDAAKIISSSDYTKKTLMETYKIPANKIITIYLAADEKFQPILNFKKTNQAQALAEKYKISLDTPYILYVGSEHPRKNFKLVLESLPFVLRDFPTVKLLKIGGPGFKKGRKESMRLIKENNLEGKVIFIEERVPDEELPYFYNLAEVFVFPSFFEGFGIPPLEAMASGCPVVSSNRTSLKEVVEDAVAVINPDRKEDMIDALLKIFKDAGFRQILRSRGLVQAKKFSWEKNAEATLKVYEEAISKSNIKNQNVM